MGPLGGGGASPVPLLTRNPAFIKHMYSISCLQYMPTLFCTHCKLAMQTTCLLCASRRNTNFQCENKLLFYDHSTLLPPLLPLLLFTSRSYSSLTLDWPRNTETQELSSTFCIVKAKASLALQDTPALMLMQA